MVLDREEEAKKMMMGNQNNFNNDYYGGYDDMRQAIGDAPDLDEIQPK